MTISRSCMTLLLVLMEMIDEKGMELSWYNCDTFEDYFNCDTFEDYFYNKFNIDWSKLVYNARESSYRGPLEEYSNDEVDDDSADVAEAATSALEDSVINVVFQDTGASAPRFPDATTVQAAIATLALVPATGIGPVVDIYVNVGNDDVN